ncbi:MAG: hypothetical protein IJL91_07380 [Bacteroidales bacterium]|nr:hypothetical protein [Bacteroidales bacterium]
MFRKLRNALKGFKMTMKMKICLSLILIGVVLLDSSIISILAYSRMSTYVSELIADNINSINVAQRLTSATDKYNLEILAVVGDETTNRLPDFNQAEFVAHCDSLRSTLSSVNMAHLADSVMYSYSAYMLTSLELPQVIASNFIDSRTWYFNRLQPVYNRLRGDIDVMNTAIYNDLKKNSATFDRGFYRSVIPGAVAIGVGLLLVILLLSFLLSYYVNPVYKMLKGFDNYRTVGSTYSVSFDGDDELQELNGNITEVVEENRQLKRRLKGLREALGKQTSSQ